MLRFGCCVQTFFPLVAAVQGHSLIAVHGLRIKWLLLLQSAGSVVVAHGLSWPMACAIFSDQGLNPCPLQWQVDSLSLFSLFIINWKIIALQYCVGFWDTPTGISHKYTFLTSLLNFLPTSHPMPPLKVVTEHRFELPALYSKFPLAIYFTYGNMYMYCNMYVYVMCMYNMYM